MVESEPSGAGAEATGLRLVMEHEAMVRAGMEFAIIRLLVRANGHDKSKLRPVEMALITGKAKLNATLYGTPAYSAALAEVGEAVRAL